MSEHELHPPHLFSFHVGHSLHLHDELIYFFFHPFMSSLIFVSLFSLRAGRHVHTSFIRRTGNKGNICHAHYKTAVACRHPPDLLAEIRIYSCRSDPLLADEMLAIVIAKGYSELKNRCNVWKFWIDCDAALDSMEIMLSTGGVE